MLDIIFKSNVTLAKFDLKIISNSIIHSIDCSIHDFIRLLAPPTRNFALCSFVPKIIQSVVVRLLLEEVVFVVFKFARDNDKRIY